jgi:hypothetical protein
MQRTFCSKLYILGWPMAAALKHHLEASGASVRLAHRAFAHLGLGRVIYHATLQAPVGAVVLVSGDLSFLDQASLRFAEHETLFLLSWHWKGKCSCNGPAKRRLTHLAFGGPTHFVALFGSQGVHAHPLETDLRRSVGHVFDYGLRPEPVVSIDPLDHPGTISLDSVLHPADLGRDVLHPTAFYASGWGIRALTADELGIAFGFPGWLRAGGLTVADFPIVPVQTMDACLRSVLLARKFVSPLVPVPVERLSAPPSSTWLPTLQKFLPHSWIDESTISSKAVKHDNAAVPTAMWDQRITLLYQEWDCAQGTRVLLFFRDYLMRSYRHRLLSEFRVFMRTTHGPFWPYRLACCRARRAAVRKAHALQPGFAIVGQGRKRRRGGLRVDSEDPVPLKRRLDSKDPVPLKRPAPGKVLFPKANAIVTGRSSATLLASARMRQQNLIAVESSSGQTRKHVSAA